MFKKIKAAGKKNVTIDEHKSSLEPSNEKDPRARMEADEERKERRKSDRDGKGESSLFVCAVGDYLWLFSVSWCVYFMVGRLGCLVGGLMVVCTFWGAADRNIQWLIIYMTIIIYHYSLT